MYYFYLWDSHWCFEVNRLPIAALLSRYHLYGCIDSFLAGLLKTFPLWFSPPSLLHLLEKALMWWKLRPLFVWPNGRQGEPLNVMKVITNVLWVVQKVRNWGQEQTVSGNSLFLTHFPNPPIPELFLPPSIFRFCRQLWVIRWRLSMSTKRN